MPMYADTRWQGLTGPVVADPVTGAAGTIGVNAFANVDDAIAAAENAAAQFGVPADVVVNGDDGSGTYGHFGAVTFGGVAPATLFLQDGPVDFSSFTDGANPYTGAVANAVLNGVGLTVGDDNSNSGCDGSISGSGSFAKVGGGSFEMSGTDSAGSGTIVSGGYLYLYGAGSITGGGGVTVLGQGVLIPTATGLANTTVTVDVDGGLDPNGLTAVALGGLAGTGAVALDGAGSPVTLTVGSDNADTEYDGVFMGSGSLVKNGFGKLTVAALNDQAGMGTTVTDGFLTITGTLNVPTPAVLTVPAGGTFDGISPIAGSDSVDADINVSGTFGAGTASAPGQLGVHSLDLAPSSSTPGTFTARLFGTSPGTGTPFTGYDQTTVFLAATIGTTANQATLNVTGNQFASGTVFTLIHDRVANISGRFAGLPDNGDVICTAGPTNTVSGQYYAIGGYDSHDITLTAIAAPVASVVVNDGSAQRSEVRSITVTYSTLVDFMGDPAAAFALQHVSDAQFLFNLHAAVSITTLNGSFVTVVTLTFDINQNAPAEVDPVSIIGTANLVPGPSLGDGRFTLFTGTYVSPTDTVNGGAGQIGLFRLFGDANGDGHVDETDLGQFRTTYNSAMGSAEYLYYFDADNSGAIGTIDLDQFRVRFHTSVF
jgi:hypothetical protein